MEPGHWVEVIYKIPMAGRSVSTSCQPGSGFRFGSSHSLLMAIVDLFERHAVK
jgi:hypothetical protein